MSTRALLESTGDGSVDKRGACHSTFVNCYRRLRRVDAKSSGCLSIRPPTARRAGPGGAVPGHSGWPSVGGRPVTRSDGGVGRALAGHVRSFVDTPDEIVVGHDAKCARVSVY